MFEKETEEWYVILNMNCKYEICRGCPKSGLFKGSLKECDDWIKQKQKDEIKDKISMTLKDPILQQGFEIICKENAELDCQMNRNKYCYSCVNATDRCFRKEIGCPCEKYKSYKDENAELKEKISILLSCKDCPENKGGWICAKEYDNKCLAQKITFIKELKKENAVLKKKNSDKECLKRLAKKGYIKFCSKANEWHYMKDGIMPEENQWVLVYDGSYTVCNYHSNTPIKWLDNYENEVYEGNIIAWKEITLPKGI